MMPNGGSDCCGTCWFNRKNRGEAGYGHSDSPEPDYCEIRETPIDGDPFYTYCANHPHHNPGRIRTPIGPITLNMDREVWLPSPDTEEIRQQLVDMLDSIERHDANDHYPSIGRLAPTIIWQLVEFREQRAVPGLRRIARSGDGYLATIARQALEHIAG